MSLLVYASFTGPDGTDLVNYTPELGGPFLKHASFTDVLNIQLNRAGKDTNAGTAVYYASIAPQVRDYSVKGVVVDIASQNRAFGIAGWIDPAADNMVVARRQNATTWQFLTIVAGSGTSLETIATSFSEGVATQLEMARLGNQFWFRVGGVTSPLSPHTITDPVFQSPGRIGLRASNHHTGTGYHVDTLSADTLTTPYRNPLRPRPFAPGIAR